MRPPRFHPTTLAVSAVTALALGLAQAGCQVPPSAEPSLAQDRFAAIPPPPSPAPEQHSRSLPWWYEDPPRNAELHQLGLGVEHACALTVAGELRCWGLEEHGRCDPPSGAWRSLAVGGEHACALDAQGGVSCWGRDTDGSTQPPPGPMEQISAGFAHSCGLRADGTVACWGWDADGQAQPPDGRFASVYAGYHHSCALDAAGQVSCWGQQAPDGTAPAGVSFTSLALGQHHSCGLDTGGAIRCWGAEGRPEGQGATLDAQGIPHSPPHQGGWVGGLLTAPPGRYLALGAGGQHSCALHEAGGVICWGHDAAFQARPPGVAFRALAVGFYHSCGVTQGGQPTCWGWKGRVDRAGQEPPRWRADGSMADPKDELPVTCPFEGLGMLYLSQGRHQDAYGMLSTAAELVPHLEHGKYNGLARIHMERGDIDAARAMLERSVIIAPEPSNEAWRLLEQLEPVP